MADYLIHRTDVANGQFTIKPYTTNGPATPTAATPLDSHATSANTSLILLGQGMYDYGQIIATDFVHLLENFSGPTAPVYPIQGQLWYDNSIGSLYIYDNGSFTTQPIVINGKLTIPLNVNNQRITNVATPVGLTDAVNKTYADTNFLGTSGGTITSGGNIIFSGGGEILGLPATPTTSGSAASKLYVDTLNTTTQVWAGTQFLLKSGDTMTGNLTMAPDTRIYLPTPTGGFVSAGEVVNKLYVDSVVTGSTTFVQKIGDTMTGPLVINGGTMYTGATLTIISVDTIGNSITVGGDVTANFTTNVQFSATLDGIPYVFTTLSSTYNVGPADTTIFVSEAVPVTVAGIISTLPGLSLTNQASASISGSFNIVGSGNLIDFGHNLLQSVLDPVAQTDAATKNYVDNAIAGTVSNPLVSATFANNTLTLYSVSSTITVTGIADQVHSHLSGEVVYDAAPQNITGSVIRDALNTQPTYPAVSLTDAISILDSRLYEHTIGNDRYVFHVQAVSITAVSAALASNLTITAVTTGAGGTYTVSGGDYTTTFIPGIIFSVSGNTGVPGVIPQTVLSSAFNVGTNDTTITVVGTVNPLTTPDGVVLRLYGAVKALGVYTTAYTTGSRIVISGNGGTGNGNYNLASTYLDTPGTSTFFVCNSVTPLPAGTTATGSFLPINMILPFNYTVEANSLQVFRQGVKQYNSVRAHTKITIPVVGTRIPLDQATNLTAGTYTFTITADGGLAQTMTISPSYTNYTITAVDTVNNSWTITGAPAGYLSQFKIFEVVGNTGLGGVTTTYSVKSITTVGPLTTIFTNEVVSNVADISGTVRKPYKFIDMVNDINTQISLGTYPSFPPILMVRDGFLYFYSGTVGATSAISIVDVNFWSLFTGYSQLNMPGADYTYTEYGSFFAESTRVDFLTGSLPVANDVYEFINIE